MQGALSLSSSERALGVSALSLSAVSGARAEALSCAYSWFTDTERVRSPLTLEREKYTLFVPWTGLYSVRGAL